MKLQREALSPKMDGNHATNTEKLYTPLNLQISSLAAAKHERDL